MELQCLLEKGYDIINELNGFETDMKRHESVLKINGLQIQKTTKNLIHDLHDLINHFGIFLQNVISFVVSDKIEILKSHSKEINECVQYISKLCMMAESVVQITDPIVKKQKSQKLIEQLTEGLKQCEELRKIDYKGFVALDLDVNLEALMKIPFVKITTSNSSTGDQNELLKLRFSDMKTLDSFFQSGIGRTTNWFESKCDETDSGYKVQPRKPRSNISKAFACTATEENFQNIRPRTPYTISPHSKVDNVETLEIQVKQEIATPVAKKENAYTASCSKEKAEAEKPNQPQIYSSSCWKSKQRDDQCSQSISIKRGGRLSDNKPTAIADHDQRMQTHCKQRNTVKMEDDESSKIKAAFASNDQPNKSRVKKDANDFCPLKQTKCVVEKVNYGSFSNAGEKESNCNSYIAYNPEQIQGQLKGVFALHNQDEALKTKHNFRATSADNSEPQTAKSSGQVLAQDLTSGVHQRALVVSSSNVDKTFNLQSLITFDKQGMPVIEGTFITRLNGGSSPFSHPTGVAVNSLGQVIVTDTANNLVKVMDNNKVILIIGEDECIFTRPSAVVIDSQNKIYVKDDKCIQVFDCNGRKVHSAGHGVLHNPYGLALAQHTGSPFAVFVDTNKRKPCVYHYHTEKGNLQSYPYDPLLHYTPVGSKVRFLAVHNGIMLASDLGCSLMYLTYLNGKILKVFGNFGHGCGEFNEPSGVAVDAFGNWLVADSKNNRIQAFSKDGNFLAMLNLSCSIGRPSGIHLSSQGHLYIINYLHGTIDVYKFQ